MKKKSIALCIMLSFGFSFSYNAVFAAMSSANFVVDSDVVGSVGGASASTNFTLENNAGEMSPGGSSSANFTANAGFLQNDAVIAPTISISVPSDVAVGAITGTGQSSLTTNSATWTIITNNPNGYDFSWQATNAAMTNLSADTITAYTPAIANTPEVWSVASTDSEWGAHLASTSSIVDTGVWGTGDDYATGKWLNVDNVASYTIASSTSATSLTGDDEIVLFGAEIGSQKIQPTGAYSVDVTVTATSL